MIRSVSKETLDIVDNLVKGFGVFELEGLRAHPYLHYSTEGDKRNMELLYDIDCYGTELSFEKVTDFYKRLSSLEDAVNRVIDLRMLL